MKKNLATILKERTDTIEFRSIRKKLMNVAQNGCNEFRVLAISDKCVIQLQNQGIFIQKINEFGYEKFLLSWPIGEDVPVASGS